MEVLPKALYHWKSQEVRLYERFFANAVHIVHASMGSTHLQAYPARSVIQRATARAMLAMPGVLTLAGQRSLAA